MRNLRLYRMAALHRISAVLLIAFAIRLPDQAPWPTNGWATSTPQQQGMKPRPDVHTLQSVTKSVAATLIGIAIGRGEIKGLDAKLLSFMEGYDLSRVGPSLHNATIEGLLTMRSGIEWHENDRPLDRTNTTLQLEHSPDWVQFTLNQPMDSEPGTKWAYIFNSGHPGVLGPFVQALLASTG